MPRHVTLHYTLRDPTGRVIDTSEGGTPVTYVEGCGQVIDGLDEQLRSVAPGVQTRVQVPADRAYGSRDESQVVRVKRSSLPVSGELKVGDVFRTGADRHAPVVAVVGMEGEEIILDANHPLAGMDLTFDVRVESARPATSDEIREASAGGGSPPSA